MKRIRNTGKKNSNLKTKRDKHSKLSISQKSRKYEFPNYLVSDYIFYLEAYIWQDKLLIWRQNKNKKFDLKDVSKTKRHKHLVLFHVKSFINEVQAQILRITAYGRVEVGTKWIIKQLRCGKEKDRKTTYLKPAFLIIPANVSWSGNFLKRIISAYKRHFPYCERKMREIKKTI